MKTKFVSLISSVAFLICTSVGSARYGDFSYHYNDLGDNYEHNDYYNKSMYVNTLDVDGWNDGIWYDNSLNDNTNYLIGVPDEGYYDPSCQTIDDCSTGTCSLVNSCE